MKVKLENNDQFFSYYPDIMAACENDSDGDPYFRTNPCLIVEVLSSGTQRTDLKEKLDNYISIPSLQEYVVVEQSTPYLRIFRRVRREVGLETLFASH